MISDLCLLQQLYRNVSFCNFVGVCVCVCIRFAYYSGMFHSLSDARQVIVYFCFKSGYVEMVLRFTPDSNVCYTYCDVH